MANRPTILPTLVLSAAALIGSSLPAVAQSSPDGSTPGALTVEQIVNFHSLVSQSPPVLSPGAGSHAAYTVEGARRSIGRTRILLDSDAETWTELRVAATATGAVTGLGRGSWGGSWSPDGARIAYFTLDGEDIRLVLAETARPGVTKTYPDADLWTTWIATIPEWTPDGRRLLVKLLPEGVTTGEMMRRAEPGVGGGASAAVDANGPSRTTVSVIRSDEVTSDVRAADAPGSDADGFNALPEWIRWQYGGDLAVIDLEGGGIERLTRHRLPIAWRVSPDGRHVVMTEMTGTSAGDAHFGVTVVSLDDGATVELPGQVVQSWGRGVSWSPDGSRLAYLSEGDASQSGVFVADPATGKRTYVAELKRGWDVEAPPIWSSAGDALMLAGPDTLWWVAVPEGTEGSWASDHHAAPRALLDIPGHRIGYVVAPRAGLSPRPADDGTLLLHVIDRVTGDSGFARIDVEQGRVLSIHTGPGSYGGSVRTDLASGGSEAIALYSNTREAPELWRLGPEMTRRGRVSSLNPGFDPSALGEDRLVRWTTEDGESLEGALLLPPTFREGEPVPLIVEVYGGNSGSGALGAFDRHRQLLASNGYGVLVPDVPLRVGTPMTDHARAVLPAVERLIDLGIADPERVGVTGHSYGGYGALALLVQSNRFAAAVASAAQGDLVANYGHMTADGSSRTGWSETGQGRMGAPLWEAPGRYLENSPFLLLDRVTAPLLLLHGTDDRVVPVWLAEQLFTGLRRLDRPVALARYERESHWFGDWSVPNQIDYWDRLLGWFDRYMGPG